MASPERLMRFADMSYAFIIKNAISSESGSEMMTIKAERSSKRKRNRTIATSTEPVRSADVIVLTALWVISVLS